MSQKLIRVTKSQRNATGNPTLS